MDGRMYLLENCELCPRRCQVNRLQGHAGYCGVSNDITVAHYGAHHGEEPPISGTKGSGNVFFSSCNLGCIYCQNYQISHERLGRRCTSEELVEIFLRLQGQGVHNINLVSPTPYVPFIAEAIERSRRNGITVPFVYNTHAYERVETLRALEGLIDIYLPDFKYWYSGVAMKLSAASDYPQVASLAILEMKRQVGDLVTEDGIATKGLLVRHLVLPSYLAGSGHIIRWIKDHLGPGTFISLMSQYYPLHKADQYPMLRRRIREEEYGESIAMLVNHGFVNIFVQDLESAPLLAPDFRREEPFGGPAGRDHWSETGEQEVRISAPH